jgi:hypothetical protein
MSFVDKLLDDYGAKETEFSVYLPQGEELRFKSLNDYVEIKKLHQRARAFAKSHLAGNHKGVKELAQYATDDNDLAVMAHIIADLSIEPKLSPADVLKLSKHAALIVTHIGSAITERLTLESAKSETEELDELGEG